MQMLFLKPANLVPVSAGVVFGVAVMAFIDGIAIAHKELMAQHRFSFVMWIPAIFSVLGLLLFMLVSPQDIKADMRRAKVVLFLSWIAMFGASVGALAIAFFCYKGNQERRRATPGVELVLFTALTPVAGSLLWRSRGVDDDDEEDCRIAATVVMRRFCASMGSVAALWVRTFDTTERFGKELGFGHKMRDIPVLTGNPRPIAREESWRCAYKLSDRMEFVVRDVLTRSGWSEVEVQREMDQIFERKYQGSRSSLNTWSTVEEFQRTPWYRRYKPTDDTAAKYISYEAMKLLEAALIPPSLRTDPYAHLRKRHMEDNWMNDKFSEDHAKYLTRDKLARQTKGMPQYGSITRRKFLDFEKEFRDKKGSNEHVNETYAAWLRTVNGRD